MRQDIIVPRNSEIVVGDRFEVRGGSGMTIVVEDVTDPGRIRVRTSHGATCWTTADKLMMTSLYGRKGRVEPIVSEVEVPHEPLEVEEA